MMLNCKKTHLWNVMLSCELKTCKYPSSSVLQAMSAAVCFMINGEFCSVILV